MHTMPTMNRSKLFAWAVVTFTIAVMALLAVGESTWPPLTGALFWVALLAGAELLAISLGASAAVTMAFPIQLAVAIVFRHDPAVAMAIAALGAFDAPELKLAVPLHKALFNRATAALSMGAILIPFNLWTGGAQPIHPVPILSAAALHLLSDLGLVTAAIKVETGARLRHVLDDLLPRPLAGFLLSYGLLTALGAATAIAYRRIPNGAWAVAAIMIPLLFARVGILAARGQQELSERLQRHQEGLLKVTQDMFKDRERERHKIAVEIHDSSLQSLAAAAYSCENALDRLRSGDQEGAAAALTAIRGAVSSAMVDLRESLVDLRTSRLEEGGLAATIDAFALQVRTLWGRDVEIQTDVSEEPPIPVALAAFQILQEGVTNALKHSDSDHVRARVSEDTNMLTVIVEDQGAGFDVDAWSSPGHLGLKLMDERAAQVGGRVRITTNPGDGVRLEAHLPTGTRT